MTSSLPSTSGASILRLTGFSFAVVFLAIPGVYYSYCETIRASEIKRRRRRFELKNVERERRRVIEGVGAEEEKDEERFGYDRKPLDEEEMEEIRRAFGSFAVGGRWSNAFGPEWREQGAWEWLFWKLVWQPITGRIWWNGGVPTDPFELAASLPVETPSFIKLFGFLPSSFTNSTTISPSSSSKDLSDSWDHLSASSSNSPTPTSANTPTQQPMVVSKDLTFTWIGQSTSFVQIDGVGILTDPVFAHKTIETFLAPPRLCPPPCKLADLLPGIQVVLLSHDHFDHLHPLDVLEIGDSAQWLCPLGLGRFLRSLGITRIIELDWWQTTTLHITLPHSPNSPPVRLDIAATPAQHWAARSPLDTNQALWASWVVKGEKDSIFHAGDTGYTDGMFKAIGRAFGPFSLAALPIGAYCPRWHLASQHAHPEDAVKIHQDIRAKRSIGVHHSTWILSDEHYLEPPKELARAREQIGMDEDEFKVVPPGRTLWWSKE
ncbi:beta-lactamase superfamily domain-domain-containing protein [Leucosporidium creatinivorum]|uniref:Beta-lactamase superfamily domain-domain-containing protein n=1 Tax=Leucosporidium creatinivorum TaxID=106004 RepID=A0A1Y2FFJ4_9BASI|nr:beta-lactamase superfamily domain-domain-containing protein [Leucosporidium creatinivorum]